MRRLYEALLALHPAPFRERFGAEMLAVFDEVTETRERLWLIGDLLASLARQWALRPRPAPAAVPAEGGLMLTAVDVPMPARRLIARGFLPALAVCFALTAAMKYAGRNPGFYFDPYFERARTAVQVSTATATAGTQSDAGQLPALPADSEVVTALRHQFRRSDAIALGEWHASREDSDIRIDLIRSPGFAREVRNVVFECANAMHQETLDRFLAGGDVPRTALRNVWRDVLTPGACDAPVYEAFLNEARGAGLRVFAAGPPINWNQVTTTAEVAAYVREADSFAAGIVKRLLASGEKVLIVFGAGHLWRHTLGMVIPDSSTLVSRIDREFPGRLFTVLRLSTSASEGASFTPLQGSSIGKLDANTHLARGIPMPVFAAGTTLEQVADALILAPPRPASVAQPHDPVWAAEIERRMRLRRGH